VHPLPFAADRTGVRIAVRVTPRASRTAVTGLAEEADGSTVLKAAVFAAPEGGKANAALIRLLAGAWGVPKSAVTVAAGAGDRRKTLHVAGDPGTLLPALEAWAADLPGAG
jgi:hypothetical protein